ncbi:hypothetical protein OTB17_11020 [Massilia sp. H27-R4]|nr:hypothetical protein [Massilia sp. H27-R4]
MLGIALLCAAPLQPQAQAQRGGAHPYGSRPAESSRPPPPREPPRSRDEQAGERWGDRSASDQAGHEAGAGRASHDQTRSRSFKSRFKAALAEALKRAQLLGHNVSVGVSGHPCCVFKRPSKTAFADIYQEAEAEIQAHYFGMPFKSEAHRFVFTTDDTSILKMLDDANLPHFERAAGNDAWANDVGIRSRLEQLRKQLGDGGRVIMVGHQENGHIVIRDPKGDRSYNIYDLQQIAISLNLELLVWSCESAKHAIGGVDQEFREGTLTKALISALSKPAATLGGFLDQLSLSSEVRWVFNAVEMMNLRQAVATVIDKSGHEAEVQMPAVPKSDRWTDAGGAQSAAASPPNDNPLATAQPAGAEALQSGAELPPSIWQQCFQYLGKAADICTTIFFLFLIFGGLNELIFHVPGAKAMATVMLMAAGFLMVVLGVFAAIGLGALLFGNVAAGMAALVLAGMAFLCYLIMKWLDPPPAKTAGG